MVRNFSWRWTRLTVHLARMKIVTSALLVLLALAGNAGARKQAAPSSLLPKLDIKEWALENGLRVVYLGVHSSPVVTVQVHYRAGAKDDPVDRPGLAHLFERLLVSGSRHMPPNRHVVYIDRVGGSTHAQVTEDSTVLVDTVPRAHLDFVLRMEAERMRDLLLDASSFESERARTKDDIRRRLENNPILSAFERLRALAFTKHPYARVVAGTLGDLDAISLADVRKFYDSYYQPNNAVLVVVGDVTEEEVKRAAVDAFGKLSRGVDVERPAKDVIEPHQDAPRHDEVEPSQVGLVILAYKLPGARANDMVPLRVLGSILSDGESSRLYRRIVAKQSVAVSAGAIVSELEDASLLLLYGAFLRVDQASKVEAALHDEMVALQKTLVAESELVKAKNQILSRLVFGMQDVEGLAAQLAASTLGQGSPGAWLESPAKVSAVTAKDVLRVAKTYLTPESVSVVVMPPIVPKGPLGVAP